jgi:hypothetical protein
VAGSRPLSEMPALMSSRRILFFPCCNVTVTVGVFHPEHPPCKPPQIFPPKARGQAPSFRSLCYIDSRIHDLAIPSSFHPRPEGDPDPNATLLGRCSSRDRFIEGFQLLFGGWGPSGCSL